MNKFIILCLTGFVVLFAGWYLFFKHSRNGNNLASQRNLDGRANTNSPTSLASGAEGSMSHKPLSKSKTVPAKIRGLLENPHQIHDVSFFFNTSPSDLDSLTQAYRETPLSERGKLIYALAATGDNSVAALFKYTLVEEFSGAELSREEEHVLGNILFACGFLAAKSDEAFNLLRGTATYDFWKSNLHWTCPNGYGDAEGLLVIRSMQALGYSGRPEIPAVLEQLKTENESHLASISGAFVDSAFNYHVRTEYGIEGAIKKHFFPDDTDKQFIAWERTDNGKQWLQWSLGMKTNAVPVQSNQP